jgi:hypothetical protein
MWTAVPDIYNALKARHIQPSILNWTYLCCYWRYPDKSKRVILHTWYQYSVQPPVYAVWTVFPDIYNVFTAPHIQASIFTWTYLRCNWRYHDNSMCVILQTWRQIQRTSSSLRFVNCGPSHIQCNYSTAYSGYNIQMNVSGLLLEISGQLNARYTAKFVPNTARKIQFTLCEVWSRIYAVHLQLRIFKPQYSTERIGAAIGDISTMLCAFYCKLGAK